MEWFDENGALWHSAASFGWRKPWGDLPGFWRSRFAHVPLRWASHASAQRRRTRNRRLRRRTSQRSKVT